MKKPLLEITPKGLYCERGDFYVDPTRAVDRAIVTHAHSDHAVRGSKSYLCAASGLGALRERVGRSIKAQAAVFGETIELNGVRVSLHPAGHILGSAQVRVECDGEIWVVTGDYKFGEYSIEQREQFEPIRCHTLISECTFGLPMYKWQPTPVIISEINSWWKENQSAGFFSIVGAYALGKAQRVLSQLNPELGPIYCHRDVTVFNQVYAAEGVNFPEIRTASKENLAKFGPGIVVAPPQVVNSVWRGILQPSRSSFASGWMAVKDACDRRGVDKGFILSDHSDWGGLIDTVRATEASTVLFYHGKFQPIAQYLTKQLGINARGLVEKKDDASTVRPAQQLTFL